MLSEIERYRRGRIVLVESALVLMPLLFLIFGILDSGMALWVRATIEHAAREGCRYAITYGTSPGMGQSDSIKRVVVANSLGLLRTQDVTVAFFNGENPALAGTNAPDNIVVVSAQRNWPWLVRAVMSGTPTIRLRASSADRMEGLGAGQNPPPL